MCSFFSLTLRSLNIQRRRRAVDFFTITDSVPVLFFVQESTPMRIIDIAWWFLTDHMIDILNAHGLLARSSAETTIYGLNRQSKTPDPLLIIFTSRKPFVWQRGLFSCSSKFWRMIHGQRLWSDLRYHCCMRNTGKRNVNDDKNRFATFLSYAVYSEEGRSAMMWMVYQMSSACVSQADCLKRIKLAPVSEVAVSSADRFWYVQKTDPGILPTFRSNYCIFD